MICTMNYTVYKCQKETAIDIIIMTTEMANQRWNPEI